MPTLIGEVAALYRYPVKSMAGESLEVADLGWHGVLGDRRMALRRVGDRGGFPWLTASKLPELICYTPLREAGAALDALPTHVRTPDGRSLDAFGEALVSEIGMRHGTGVEMTHLNRGVFDEASISMIATASIAEASRLAALPADVRRFRPNILLNTRDGTPFEEEQWVGATIRFGDGTEGAEIAITNYDERCSMVNFDPDTARATPELLKAIVAARGNRLGVYAAVTRCGRITMGQSVFVM
ncbi:MAG: MOSC domain-containing protein [Gemmatimonadaceae bacterium]|nr:MOSC domain-containing protein [Gemmatimonadaceae bacterium]